MSASKVKTRLTSKAHYSKRPVASVPQAGQTSLEFFITLPGQSNVAKFIDALIELVEKQGGAIGGGVVAVE